MGFIVSKTFVDLIMAIGDFNTFVDLIMGFIVSKTFGDLIMTMGD